MDKFIPVLKRTKLFAGVGDEDIVSMLSCLGARLYTYKKGEYVLRQGERLNDILVLAEGSLHIQKDDYWGNRSILGHIGVGEIFGEAYTARRCCGEQRCVFLRREACYNDLLIRLSFSLHGRAESFLRDFRKEQEPGPKARLSVKAFNEGKTDLLSFRRSKKAKQRIYHHPV